jgi:hypothetical protein
MKSRSTPGLEPALVFDVPASIFPVSSPKTLVFSPKTSVCSPLDTRSFTDLSPDDELRKDGGKRRISALRRAPAFSWSFEKGKTLSSKVTLREI